MLIYSFLALYGVLTVLILTYVHSKFRVATKTLQLLQTEWQNAESRHAGFVGAAQQKLSKLSQPAPVAALSVRKAAVDFNVRNQVIAMARRGIGPVEIGRSCGLHEGEVEVVLGMARLQK
ncbi:MAG TPA: hypothetical protein VER98_04525 [Terriglobia bacterium]|nr:hypothetical protein [Terriglobia bacterium]